MFPWKKARTAMPMQSDRTKRRRSRRYQSPLDWFAEDPWAEPDLSALEDADLSGLEDVDLAGFEDSEDDEYEDEDESSEDPYGGWGPVRRRGGRPRRSG
jgi:hypothetical protein